ADPIPDRSTTERHPTAPIPRHPERRVRPELCRSHPKIVIQSGRHFMMLVHFAQVGYLAIHLLVGATPGVNGMHLADGARPNPFANLAYGIARMPLVAKL